MNKGSFVESVLLYWLGHPLKHEFEIRLFEMGLIASLTNGPGTISSQAPNFPLRLEIRRIRHDRNPGRHWNGSRRKRPGSTRMLIDVSGKPG